MTKHFTHYVGIDWSGAKGKRHPGLAIAISDCRGVIKVINSPDDRTNWSRSGCARWISDGCGLEVGSRTLVGLDSSFSMPFLDVGSYIPGENIASGAKSLWKTVEDNCNGVEDLFGGPFVEKYSDHYLRPGKRGTSFKRRMRVAENLAVSSGAGPCESVFHLIGPSQVGLSGLSTMRMLANLDKENHIATWPYDNIDTAPIVLTEIYAAAFAALGGHKGKVRDRGSLEAILEKLDASLDLDADQTLSDHVCDAIITAAALRHIAPKSKYWKPVQLSSMVRRTEGWVFGII